jgi:hypothetical protein
MQARIAWALAGLVLASLPVHADHRYGGSYSGIYVGAAPFGYWHGAGFGYGYAYGHPYRPFWGFGPPGFGLQVAVAPRPARGPAAGPQAAGAERLFVYPAAGQSERQAADDRYECHVWASDRSGYDPTLGRGSRTEIDDYRRAFVACLEGRDYVVK